MVEGLQEKSGWIHQKNHDEALARFDRPTPFGSRLERGQFRIFITCAAEGSWRRNRGRGQAIVWFVGRGAGKGSGHHPCNVEARGAAKNRTFPLTQCVALIYSAPMKQNRSARLARPRAGLPALAQSAKAGRPTSAFAPRFARACSLARWRNPLATAKCSGASRPASPKPNSRSLGKMGMRAQNRRKSAEKCGKNKYRLGESAKQKAAMQPVLTNYHQLSPLDARRHPPPSIQLSPITPNYAKLRLINPFRVNKNIPHSSAGSLSRISSSRPRPSFGLRPPGLRTVDCGLWTVAAPTPHLRFRVFSVFRGYHFGRGLGPLHFCTISAPFLPHFFSLDFHKPLSINHFQFSPYPHGAIPPPIIPRA